MVKKGAVTSPDDPLVTKAGVCGNHHLEVMVASKSTLKHTSFLDPSRRGWEGPSGMGGRTQRCHPRGVRSWDESSHLLNDNKTVLRIAN